jgi:hypothetical protein
MLHAFVTLATNAAVTPSKTLNIFLSIITLGDCIIPPAGKTAEFKGIKFNVDIKNGEYQFKFCMMEF